MSKKTVIARTQFDDYVGFPGLVCEDFDPITGEKLPCRTKQADKEGCDIHVILRRIEQGGMLPDMIRREPRYGDFSNVKDYRESMETVLRAQEQFEALPFAVRDRFEHDPERMLEFVSDPANKDELVKLGLALPKKPQEAVPAPTTPAKDSGADSSPKTA